MLKRNAALALLVIEFSAIAAAVFFLITLDPMSLAWALSIAVAIPAWILAVNAPTVCGVTTQKGGQCRRKVNGVLFGCGTSNHTWAKFFSRFGWRRQPDPNAASSSRSRPSGQSTILASGAGGGVEVMTVRIAEDAKSKVAFWLALTATTCALVSATVDASNFVKDHQAPPVKALTANHSADAVLKTRRMRSDSDIAPQNLTARHNSQGQPSALF
ncbi:hypothetical protein ACQP2C_00355 [Micromonospora zamorensis]|uniref:hypothetical protein n=1 Tax=Micromonospora zamorensis TaxID=709883 RepID=UPI003D957685